MTTKSGRIFLEASVVTTVAGRNFLEGIVATTDGGKIFREGAVFTSANAGTIFSTTEIVPLASQKKFLPADPGPKTRY